MERLNEKLIGEVPDKDICAEGYKCLHKYNKDELVEYYLSIPDWCMEREFPNYATIETEFADCEKHGIFVNRTFDGEVLKDRQTYIFHNCRGTIKTGLNADEALIPMLYFGNGCDMAIEDDGDYKVGTVCVPLYIFGDSNNIAPIESDKLRFKVYNERLVK